MAIIANNNPFTGLLELFTDGIFCVIVINLIFAISFCWSQEFKYWMDFIQEYINKIVARKG